MAFILKVNILHSNSVEQEMAFGVSGHIERVECLNVRTLLHLEVCRFFFITGSYFLDKKMELFL